MGRILSLDYGTKRVGIAETDDLQLIASPLTTVHSKDLIQFISDYLKKHVVDVLVIGEPKNLQNEETDSSKVINEFCVYVQRKFPQLKVARVDERFTSKMASQAIAMSGKSKSKRQEKGLIDSISAAIILQSYLQLKS